MLTDQTENKRIIHDRLIPSAKTCSYRADETAGGRIITVTGEIRADPDYPLRLEELRVRQDDVARSLDLEDGSAVINAKMGALEYVLDVNGWFADKCYVPYTVTFHETS